ncbi:MAG TPA: sodium:calcium antiporter [Pseudonocardiaceae bacterium]|nr:sodium:calcium antiporter [Pseudonocardiaceae bacterium]
MVHGVLLVGCALVIYLACEGFINAVEWLGVQLNVGPIAVGTILAAVGTALPESVVTLVAVTFSGGPHDADIGVGAAMGGPLVVGTIAYAVVGATLLASRWAAQQRAAAPPLHRSDPSDRDRLTGDPTEPDVEKATLSGVDTQRLAHDQTWFLVIFVVKVSLGFLAFAIKPWLGPVFFAIYGLYLWRELRGGGPATESELEPLKLQRRRAVPTRTAVVAQTVGTLVLIFVASQLFVRQLDWAGSALGLSPVVVALLLSPVATELPETINALIWVRQGKTQLALANISGAMMIQATIPSGLGLLFTPWAFTTPLLLAGITTTAAISYLLVLLRTQRLTPWRLTTAALFYGAFALGLTTT